MRVVHQPIEAETAARKDALGEEFTWPMIIKLGIESAERIVSRRRKPEATCEVSE